MSTSADQLYQASFTRNIGVIDDAEQDRLRAARVTVVGAGGVGGIALILLARMGVGRLHVVDGDRFEASNINRQMLSGSGVVGEPKADVAERVLRDINPSIAVTTSVDFLTEQNAAETLTGSDVVIDATDNLVSRVVIHRAAAAVGAPSVWIAVSPPFRGGVMTMTPTSTPYEQVLRHPSAGLPLTPDVCAQVNAIKDERARYSVARGALPDWSQAYLDRRAAWAVLAPVANIVGLLASFEAFKLIIARPGLEPVIGPRLVRVDLSRPDMVEAVTPAEGSWDNRTL